MDGTDESSEGYRRIHKCTEKLLSYNLGKEGRETTLRKEIEMVKNYIFLQQKRYDFEVDIAVEEGEYLNVPTVRMMLQPLVENAIRYGLGEEGKIAIQTFFDKNGTWSL